MDEPIGKALRKGSGKLKLQITIDGKAYEVEVEVLEDEESPAPPSHAPHHAAHAQSFGGPWDRDGKVCHSPVTGLVIKVNVKPGQTVEAGELILVLEAMKMETNVMAPHAGTVKSVHVAPGDSVKMNQVLVECE
jgi:methylmalonyl-CoA carboxyltransferase small subunit